MSSDPTPPLARPWPCRMRRLTPDEVLAQLRAYCAEMIALQPDWVTNRVVPDASVRTLHELEPEHDWGDFPGYFGLDLDQDWWDEWATPNRTVRALCEDLAERIAVPVFEPVTMLGRECLTAGAFLAIRRLLADDGADADRIGPSSPLAPYLARHSTVFRRVRLVAPGRVAPLEENNPIAAVGCCLFLFAGLTLSIGWAASGFVLPITGVVLWLTGLLAALGGAALAVATVVRRTHNPTRIPGISDFRHLVYALLGRTPQRTTTPDSLS